MPRWPKHVPIGDPADRRSFETLIAAYLEWREVRGMSVQSRQALNSTLRTFGHWCEERSVVRPVEVSREMVERYQRWLFHYRKDDGRPLSIRSQMNLLAHLRGFYRWLSRERYMLYNPTSEMELPKMPLRLPVDGFSLEEVETILAGPDLTTVIGLRDRALLELLYSTGIRRAEAAELDVYDVDFLRGCLTVRQGKGGRDRVVPVGERALAWVRKYLEEGRTRLAQLEEKALFVTVEGERLRRNRLGIHVKALIQRSGVRQRQGSCHLFRHTMATQMLEGGADVRYVQEMLGHAKLTTTQLYTHVSIGKLKAVHTATHPAARLSRSRPQAGREESEEDLALEAEVMGSGDVVGGQQQPRRKRPKKRSASRPGAG